MFVNVSGAVAHHCCMHCVQQYNKYRLNLNTFIMNNVQFTFSTALNICYTVPPNVLRLSYKRTTLQSGGNKFAILSCKQSANIRQIKTIQFVQKLCCLFAPPSAKKKK